MSTAFPRRTEAFPATPVTECLCARCLESLSLRRVFPYRWSLVAILEFGLRGSSTFLDLGARGIALDYYAVCCMLRAAYSDDTFSFCRATILRSDCSWFVLPALHFFSLPSSFGVSRQRFDDGFGFLFSSCRRFVSGFRAFFLGFRALTTSLDFHYDHALHITCRTLTSPARLFTYKLRRAMRTCRASELHCPGRLRSSTFCCIRLHRLLASWASSLISWGFVGRTFLCCDAASCPARRPLTQYWLWICVRVATKDTQPHARTGRQGMRQKVAPTDTSVITCLACDADAYGYLYYISVGAKQGMIEIAPSL